MRIPRPVTLALAATLLVGAACSDSVDDDAGGSTTTAAGGATTEPATRTTRGVTDDSVKVGGVVYDVYYGDAHIGVEARLKEVNDAGGVHGRTIEFVGTENDGNVPTTGLEITQRLVEQEQVFALLPVLSGTYGGGDYIAQEQVPTFGWGTTGAFCENDVAFGMTGCVTNPKLEIGSNALGLNLKEHFDGDTEKSVAIISEDNDSGRGAITLLSASVAAEGFDVVYAESTLPPPPDPLGDPSPFVADLLTADGGEQPDAIYIAATLSGTAIAASLQEGGYTGMILTSSYSPLLLGQPGYDGVYVNTQFDMDPSVPANATMLEAVAAVDAEAKLNLAIAAGYWAADFFVKALEETGEDLTVERLLATLNGGDFAYEVPDVVGPSTWPEFHDKPVPCSALTHVQGTEFVPANPLLCGENIEIG